MLSVFQVCELHFRPEEIGKETSYYDEKTGTRITARLKKPFLHDGVVPSILPECPSYLSSSTPSRESPDSEKIQLEESALKTSVAQSVTDEVMYKQHREFHSVDDLEGKLKFLDMKFWSVVRQEETLFICHIIKFPYPKMSLSLMTEPDCAIKCLLQRCGKPYYRRI